MGSTLAGLMDSFARSVSYGLQYGVPLKTYVKGLSHMSFAPSGITDDPEIRTASSLVDYIFRRLALTYLSFDDRLELGMASIEDMPEVQTTLLETLEPVVEPVIAPSAVGAHALTSTTQATTPVDTAPATEPADIEQPRVQVNTSSAPLCYNCGNQTQRAGSCYVCTSCGSTTGCS
jgi:ribonucleoside-diphosphate reductase alpha chain